MAEGEVRIKDITNTVTSLNNNFYFVVDDGGITDKTYKYSAQEYLTIAQHLMGALNNEIDTTTAIWSASGSYVKGDVVINPIDARIYACNVANATVGTFVSSEWSALTLMGISGALFVNMSAEPMTFNQPISKGDVVYRVADASPYNPLYRGFYRAKADHPEGVASYVASDWDYFESLTALISDCNNRIVDLEDDMETKANTSGEYLKLTTGLSHNVLGDGYEADNSPYVYRQSPKSSGVDLSLVGGTIAWNQLVQPITGSASVVNEVTVTPNGDGSVTLNGTASQSGVLISASNISVYSGHKYYLAINGSVDANGYSTIGGGTPFDKIVKQASSSGNITFSIRSSANITYNNNRMWPICIDLTQAFGSTIADYVYTLEQATAGSGIAWLKSYGFLTKDYYAYQSGKLESVNVSSRKVVGKNLVYNVLSTGSIGSSGAIGTSESFDMACAKVKQGVTYTIKTDDGQLVCGFFTSEPQIGSIAYNNARLVQSSKTFVAPIDGYVAFRTSHGYATPQLEIGTTATQYEPYTSTTYSFDSSKILRGIPKLSNGQMYYDGDVMSSDGNVKRKYGVVDLGTLDWSYYNGVFYANIPGKAYKNTTKDCFCAKYVVAETNAVNVNDASTIMADKQLCGFRRSSGTSENSYIYAEDSAYTDAQAFTTAMNGVYLVYELATPTTESATPFTNPQLVGSTEEFIDAQTSASTPTRDVDIPVGQDSRYMHDIKGKVEQLYGIPEVPSTNGTYTLKATRSASGVVYNWVSG